MRRGFIEGVLDFIVDGLLPFLAFLLTIAVITAGVIVGKTERETKFVDYSWWTWDCLTPAHDGKWIPTDALREVAR